MLGFKQFSKGLVTAAFPSDSASIGSITSAGATVPTGLLGESGLFFTGWFKVSAVEEFAEKFLKDVAGFKNPNYVSKMMFLSLFVMHKDDHSRRRRRRSMLRKG